MVVIPIRLIRVSLGKNGHSHKNAETQVVAWSAFRTGRLRDRVAVVAVSHLNKGEGAAIYRTMGSLAFVAAGGRLRCRSR